jgi:diamine N-acetyltransferase
MPNEVIRAAGPDDAPALAALATRTFQDTYAAFNTPENMAAHLAQTFSPEKQRQEIEDPTGFVLLAEAGELIAYAQVTGGHVPADVRDPGALELKRFYVDRAWHGLGVAQRLMTETIRTAAQRGAATVWLTVWDQNPRAIAFYRKAGFEQVGLHPFQLGNEVQTDLLLIRRTAP